MKPKRPPKRRRPTPAPAPAVALSLGEPKLRRPLEFFARHPIFRREEFFAAHAALGRKPSSSAAVLRQHQKSGRLVRLKESVYWVTDWAEPDEWLVGSRLTPDAVIAYDGAAAFHHLSELEHSITVLSAYRLRYFLFADVIYRAVAPGTRRVKWETFEVQGLPVRVTPLEHTLVDLLDRPDLGPGPLELWSYFTDAGPLDVAEMVAHAEENASALARARLGYLLDRLDPHLLSPYLRGKLRLPHPGYFDAGSRDQHQRFDRASNLSIPEQLALAVRAFAEKGYPREPSSPRERSLAARRKTQAEYERRG